MVPDTGERYLSTPLFADIDAEMNADEWAISRSTDGARFDALPVPAAVPASAVGARVAPAEAPANPAADAAAPIDDIVAGATQPVVMFALEWCEFCWTLRRFFQRIGVPLHAVDLDAAALQADGRGARIRAALQAKVGQATIPQVFVGGAWLGGCMDTLAAWQDGRLQALLAAQGVAFDATAVDDPRALLPAWLQTRQPVAS